MFTQILRLAIVAAAFTFAVPAMAQSWQDNFSAAAHQTLTGGQNCGRTMTQHHAESLWADYCTENCAYPGGLGGGGRLGKCGKCGLGGGSCGCNSGSFGYPTGGGGGGCGGGCKLKALHGGGCGGKLKGLHGGGGCGCKLKGLHGGCGCKLFGGCKKFGRSAEQCGTSGAYFDEAVGYEYGTSGIESCVSCNSCGSFDSMAPEMATPVMMESHGAVDFMAPAEIQGSSVMAAPVDGSIGAFN